jgi:hypothetical protein
MARQQSTPASATTKVTASSVSCGPTGNAGLMNCGKQHFRVRQRDERALPHIASMARGDRDFRRRRRECRPQPADPEPGKIRRAGPADHVEPFGHDGHRRSHADGGQRHQEAQAEGRAEHGQQRRACSMGGAVCDEQRHIRTGRERQKNAGKDEGAVEFDRHRSSLLEVRAQPAMRGRFSYCFRVPPSNLLQDACRTHAQARTRRAC